MLRTSSGAVLLLALASTLAESQTIRGRLIEDGSDSPVTAAQVSLVDEHGNVVGSTRPDSLGHFTLATYQPGRYRLHAVAAGFKEATSPAVSLAVNTQIVVRFVLSREVILIAPLEITARSRPLVAGMSMQGYHERRAKGQGFAITREDIEKRSARTVTDLLRMAPGVRIESRRGTTSISIPGTAPRFKQTCQVKVLVDGTEFRWGSSTIDDIPVYDIEAIEVFRSLADLPPEMAGTDATCGVIAVWTKRGSE
jgi:hypothetical protein